MVKERVKPTHTDPEDDRRSDPALLSGSTLKACDPVRDQGFFLRILQLMDLQRVHQAQATSPDP